MILVRTGVSLALVRVRWETVMLALAAGIPGAVAGVTLSVLTFQIGSRLAVGDEVAGYP